MINEIVVRVVNCYAIVCGSARFDSSIVSGNDRVVCVDDVQVVGVEACLVVFDC